MKLFLGIVAGFITGAILSLGTDEIMHATGVFPPPGEPFMDTGPVMISTVYRAIYQVIGAYIAALIAKEKAMLAAWIIGGVGTLFWIAGTVAMMGMSPIWYGIVGAILSIPTTLAGAKMYLSRINRQAQSDSSSTSR